jgi:uncharacterized phiE125 gp8 family phage protein
MATATPFQVWRSARTVVTTAPDNEPISLDEAKIHLHRTDDAQDTLIWRLVVAARQRLEEDTGRALLTQTHDAYCDAVPSNRQPLWIPKPPLVSVTTVKSYTTANVESTMSASKYLVDIASTPGRIALNDGETWPTDLRKVNALIVRYVAGYGATAISVPEPLRQAMLLIVGALFEHREQVMVSQFAGQFLELPYGYDQLIAPFLLGVDLVS